MAREMNDYLLDADNDLKVVGGDLVVGESTYQHQRQLLLNVKGAYKANPTICVGLATYQDNDDKGAVVTEIAQQFMRDGMTVNDLSPNPQSLTDDTVTVFNNSFYE